jgi:D-glycero-D-manno-heptose 1,7-bisphosphate phosphatase
MKASEGRCVLLEREGVLLRRVPAQFGQSWKEYEFLPRALDALRLFAKSGIDVRIVSQQPGLSAGTLTTHELERQTRRMLMEVALSGGRIERVYYCRHSAEEHCHCRKPLPGMLLQAIRDSRCKAVGTVMIGDLESDMETAARAGCGGVLLRRDAFLTSEVRSSSFFQIASNLYEAAKRISGQNVIQFSRAWQRGALSSADGELAQLEAAVQFENEPA